MSRYRAGDGRSVVLREEPRALAAIALVAAMAVANQSAAAPARSDERGGPGAVPNEIADLWTEALVERFAIAGGKLVVSEKPEAPDAALCIAVTGPAEVTAPSGSDAGLRALEMRGGTFEVASGAPADTWCATFPSNELSLGVWLAGTLIRNRAAASVPSGSAPPVTSEQRAVALAEEGAEVGGPAAPNFVIAVSGGVAAPDVVSRAEAVFGERALSADVSRTTLSLHQSSERLSIIEAPVPAPKTRYGFVTAGDARQRAALAVAVEVLAGGLGSRLHRDLVVRRFLAHSVSPWASALPGGVLYGVELEISTRTSLDRARRFVDGAIKQLRLVGPSHAELFRARRRMERRALLTWENVTERAKTLSVYELTQGDARVWPEELGAAGMLTEENVRQAAHDAFVDARRTTVETYPPLWPEDDPRLSQYRTYTVEPGDALPELASRFGVTAQSIATANDLDLRYRLVPGQALLIPPK